MPPHNFAIFLLSLAFVASAAGSAPVHTEPRADIAAFASEAVIRELKSTRPEFTALGAADQAALYLWLTANCGNGADERRQSFTALAGRIELVLVEAFRMGPPTALLSELADTRRAQFAVIQQELKAEGNDWIKASVRTRIAALSEEGYVNQGLDATIQAYRLAALHGLELNGSETSMNWLGRRIPTLTDPEIKRAAETAFAAIHRRQHGAGTKGTAIAQAS